MSNAEQFYIYRPTKPIGAINVAEDALPWMYDQDPSSGFCARMLVVPADALAASDKRIAELEELLDERHEDYRRERDRLNEENSAVLECLKEAERKLAVARDELLRCKRIMLHECGIGLVNEVVLAQIGGEDAPLR